MIPSNEAGKGTGQSQLESPVAGEPRLELPMKIPCLKSAAPRLQLPSDGFQDLSPGTVFVVEIRRLLAETQIQLPREPEGWRTMVESLSCEAQSLTLVSPQRLA